MNWLSITPRDFLGKFLFPASCSSLFCSFLIPSSSFPRNRSPFLAFYAPLLNTPLTQPGSAKMLHYALFQSSGSYGAGAPWLGAGLNELWEHGLHLNSTFQTVRSSSAICVYIYYIKKQPEVWLFPYCKCMSILDATCPWNHLCGYSFSSSFWLDQFFQFFAWGCGGRNVLSQIRTINHFLLVLNFC